MVADINKPVAEEAGDAVENVAVEEPMEENEPELTKEEKIVEMEKLMKKGNRSYILQDFEEATESFSVATELSVDIYGEFAPQTFEPHFQYGRSLIEMVFLDNDSAQTQLDGLQDYLAKKMEERKQKLGVDQPDLNDSVVGNPDDVPESERKEVIEAVDKALEENAAELEALAETAEDGEIEESTEDKAETETADDKAESGEETTEKVEGDEEEDDGEEGSGAEEEEADATSAELAWEILEVARTICEKQESNKEWDLRKSEVLHYIGQLSVVEEKFTDAIESILGAIELRKKYFPEHDRISASYLFEVAEAWKLNNDFVRAAEFYRQSENALKTFITETEKTLANLSEDESKKANSAIEEVKKMLPEIVGLIIDASESARSREEQQTEMAKMESPEKVKPPSDDENMEPVNEITVVRKKRPAAEISPDASAKKTKVEEQAGGDAVAAPVETA